jgi:Fe-S cluster assembly protein SufB
LHAAVVEVIAKKNSYIRYTTIQNWSSNVYNLVTKRAIANENAVVEWLDGNIGSKVTMKYPCITLKGKGARGEVLSVAYAGKGQHQDAGAKIIHQAPNTSSQIISKSISQGGGRSTYRGLMKVLKGAKNCKAFVQCDAFLLDKESRSDTYPKIQIDEDSTTIAHEAKVGKIADDKMFYLMSKGLSEKEALALIVLGFIESFTKELPMEYAVELNRLVEIQLEGAVG